MHMYVPLISIQFIPALCEYMCRFYNFVDSEIIILKLKVITINCFSVGHLRRTVYFISSKLGEIIRVFLNMIKI